MSKSPDKNEKTLEKAADKRFERVPSRQQQVNST
jgi:hypothetical protein